MLKGADDVVREEALSALVGSLVGEGAPAPVVASAVALHGHANCLEGLELLSIYVIAALVFWYL